MPGPFQYGWDHTGMVPAIPVYTDSTVYTTGQIKPSKQEQNENAIINFSEFLVKYLYFFCFYIEFKQNFLFLTWFIFCPKINRHQVTVTIFFQSFFFHFLSKSELYIQRARQVAPPIVICRTRGAFPLVSCKDQYQFLSVEKFVPARTQTLGPKL